jgi:formylglycine-generating enzyme required for sulfatase activity
VVIPAGTFAMGDAFGDGLPEDGEQPVHRVSVGRFSIDATCVTNDAFAAFAASTGYVTDAERFGYSAVFHLLVTAPDSDVLGAPDDAAWWRGVRDAHWRQPGGRGSSIDALGDHPVVHVSHHDALAYCAWAGRRLPSEAEWECAARGGLAGARYPWGDALVGDDAHRCNIWQGDFPTRNTREDGYVGTAPVRCYAPNGYGLWQVSGNVWEWCADWYDASYYARSPSSDPRGPAQGERRVMRGGSYLCHDSYCNRYRVAARGSNTPDSSSGNVGFRTVAA